jgi:DNA-binding CsgD family transcriptional regulator
MWQTPSGAAEGVSGRLDGDDGAMSDIARKPVAELRPLSPGLSIEVLDWVSELRVIWTAAGLSMNEFASLHPIDKGTISRYLNGQRVPRDHWFLDRLLAIQADSGRPVTPAVREHLTGLHLRALEVAHPHGYRVRLVSDELEIAVTSRLEAERYAASLEQQLVERNRQVQELADDKGRLRAAWDSDRTAMQAERERLTREIDMIARQLNLARQREAQASRRCQHLEGLLDHLDILPTADDGHTSMRFPGDGPEAGQRPDLAALSPREWDVLSLIAEGLSNRGICKRLNYSQKSVDHLVSGIFAKLGLAATGGRSQTDANHRVLATLAFLDATTRSARPHGTSSSPDSPRTSRATGEPAPSGGVADRLDQQVGVVVNAGDGLAEADGGLAGEAGREAEHPALSA